ncbi:hypothetical protein O5O45_26695 [Hahella aquimaris]|uniref:hypothetical protein n=1 Tax=Hahella sp. HNIBRBA332 TaxID=3015983 RepID=UPI00273C6606|nr:hypothetical protein [Hahella sp. HNIBRBA332]WLQ13316.1 hypothetical protein O5O45_26695 [Hahella sp. HNIBRBA332]
MKKTGLLIVLLLISGCTSIGINKGQLPSTLGESESGYGYIPLDGLAISQTLQDDSCKDWRLLTGSESLPSTAFDIKGAKAGEDPFKPLLETLPDISVRFAVASFDSNGGLSFGPAKVTIKGKKYRAILDYVNIDTIPVSLWITAFKNNNPVKIGNTNIVADYYEASILTIADQQPTYPESQLVTVPVYVGIGMRLSADITAIEGDVPLTSLGAIGLEAQSKKLTGTLTVQTIGITGESVATSLPLPSSLDQTTIENGILSIGSNRAVVYRPATGTGGIYTTPRVVGLYSPVGSEPALVNAIYSELSRERPKWPRPCKAPSS